MKNEVLKKYKKITKIIFIVGIIYYIFQLLWDYKNNDITIFWFPSMAIIMIFFWYIDHLQGRKVCRMIKEKKIDNIPVGRCIFQQLNLKKHFKKFKIRDKKILLEIEIWNYKRLWLVIFGFGQFFWQMFIMIFFEALKQAK